GRVQFPSASEPRFQLPVVVPAEVQAMLARTDFMSAKLLESPVRPGIRVRLLVSPDVGNNELTFGTCLAGRSCAESQPPALTQWTSMDGKDNKLYDSWGWDRNGGRMVAGAGRVFKFTKEWRLTSMYLPADVGSNQFVNLRWALPGWKKNPVFEYVTVARYDDKFQQTTDPNGVPF